MRTRQELENLEAHLLAPYGMRSGLSRGRAYPEAEPAYRTAFQRDRERVIHTTAFRRLQGKTQVFIVGEADFYRTRITHTMEVAQIGRTIARSLGANEDLVEGICLAHDLGHPPFGHSGEYTLDALMRNHGGFNHNQHSYRIITELEHRYVNFPGLNLTYEFREGISKHETDYDVSTPKGYEPSLRGTLESQIASFADELAYNGHDLDDGLRAGLLNPDEARQVRWWQAAAELAEVGRHEPVTDLVRHRVVRKLVGEMVNDLIIETSRRIEAARIASPDDVRTHPEALVSYSERAAGMTKELKTYLFDRLYRHYRVMRMTSKAERVLTDLFKAYTGEPRILPDGTREALATLPLERVVCTYIAGMTDRFALEEHARLFDPHERV